MHISGLGIYFTFVISTETTSSVYKVKRVQLFAVLLCVTAALLSEGHGSFAREGRWWGGGGGADVLAFSVSSPYKAGYPLAM